MFYYKVSIEISFSMYEKNVSKSLAFILFAVSHELTSNYLTD